MKESIEKQKDVALDEITTPTAKEALRSKAKTLDKHEQLCELSKALAVLASASVRIALFTFSTFSVALFISPVKHTFPSLSFSL